MRLNMSNVRVIQLVRTLKSSQFLRGTALAVVLLPTVYLTILLLFRQAPPASKADSDYSFEIARAGMAGFSNTNYNLRASFADSAPRVTFADSRNKVSLVMEPVEMKKIQPVQNQTSAGRDQLVYAEVWPGVDLAYEIIPDGIKETLIVKTAEAVSGIPEGGFGFQLDLEGLKPGVDEDGSFSRALVDANTGQAVMQFLPPFMVDATGVRSDAVSLTIEQCNNETTSNAASAMKQCTNGYLAALSPDPAWLSDPDRVFPIYIDPTVKGNAPVAEWHIDEAYGTTVYDDSGNSNNLTLSGPAWTVTDARLTGNTRYLEFDGSNDYLTRATDTDFDFGTGSFSIAGWFRHVSAISGTDILLSYAGAVDGVGYKVYMNASGNICFGIDDTAGSFPEDAACSSDDYSDSRWHHFEAVKDGTTSITIYIDGQEVDSNASLGSVATLNASSTLYIGIDADGSSNPWDGFLDNMFVYNYARTAAQVKADLIGQGPQIGVSF